MGIVVTPHGETAYVADMGSAQPTRQGAMVAADTVTPVNLATDTPLSPIEVGPGVGAVDITPDGHTVLAAYDGAPRDPAGGVVPIDVATGKAGKAIPTGIAPMGIAITPDGNEALVANTGWQSAGDLGDGDTVTPINLRTDVAGRPIPVGKQPINIVITPNGSEAFVADSNGSEPGDDHGSVTPINVATGHALPPIPMPGGVLDVAITPDGKTLYAIIFHHLNDSVLVPINVATRRAGTPITVATGVGAIAITADVAGICHGG